MEQVLVDPAQDRIEVNGKKVDITKAGQHMYYFVVNKPKVHALHAIHACRHTDLGMARHEAYIGTCCCASHPKPTLMSAFMVLLCAQGYICSNTELPGKEGKRAVDLLQPWLDEWQKHHKGQKVCIPCSHATAMI